MDTSAPSSKKRKAPKGEEAPGDLAQRMLALEHRISDQDTREQLSEILAQLQRNEAHLLELKAHVPQIVAKAPIPLNVDEVAKIIEKDGHAKFRALTGDRGLSIRAGDVFDPTARFETSANFLSRVRGGRLKVARAA